MRFGQEHIGALVQGRYSLVTQQRSRVLGPAYQAHDHEESSEVFLKLFLRWPQAPELQTNLEAWLKWGRFDSTSPDQPWGPCPMMCGRDERGFFLISPWTYGGSSSGDWFPAGEPSVADIVALLISTLESLQLLHDQGLIHGALRPSQVLLSESGQVVLLRPGLDLFVVPTLRHDADRWALVRASRVQIWAPEVRAKIEQASAPFPTETADVFGFGRVMEAAIELLPDDLGTPRERLIEVAQDCLQSDKADRPNLEEVLRRVEASTQRHRRPRASAPSAGAGESSADWSRMRGSSGRPKTVPGKPAPATSAVRRRMPSTDIRARDDLGLSRPAEPAPVPAAPPISEDTADTGTIEVPNIKDPSSADLDADDLRRMWIEAETFAKYGLIKQAVSRAKAILQQTPSFEPALDLVERLAPPPDESLALSNDELEEEPLGPFIDDFEESPDSDQTILMPNAPEFEPEPNNKRSLARKLAQKRAEAEAPKADPTAEMEPTPSPLPLPPKNRATSGLDQDVQFTVYRPNQ
ncbi:MAG: hypothetical protein AAF449_08345, partial [Myxococcota bacterium]